MKIHIGSDHAGYELKTAVINYLQKLAHDVIDHGALTYNSDDDYPVFCIDTAKAVMADLKAGIDCLGIVIGGSGNGEQISANKVSGVRCALVWNEETAKLARQHNNANIVSLGARMYCESEAIKLVKTFINEPFSNGTRHIRRIKLISDYEINKGI
ncbi:MAG: ribose-5-phosphate isomerase [Bifidobacteriaceae bacterium]|jgi:ribose 5-phosphate isomerase B|nr:ribose-5-phosphate isomerase [Bifidobacteriaceae bacterium]